MKKNLSKSAKSVNTRDPRSHQAHRRGSLFWVFVAAFCFVAFIGVFGAASASQASQSSSPALSQKMKLLQPHQGQPQSASQSAIPSVQPAPTRQAGIVNMQQGPFLSTVFTVHNFWQGPVNHDWLLAYAGLKPGVDGTDGTGGIMLYTEVANAQGGFDLRLLGMFLAPKETSGLTITSVGDLQLQLRSDTGSVFTFDLQTHQFH